MKRGRLSLVLLVACVAAGLAGGCGGAPPSRTPESATPPPAASGSAGERVAVTVDGSGFHPDRIPARAGQPITLAITRTTDETCGTEIVIPSLEVNRKLPLDETVEVTVTPAGKGEIAFACGMDMLKGAIVVQ